MNTVKSLPLKAEDDSRWGGFTRKVEHPFPIEAVWRDGYGVTEPKEDARGTYWNIVKLTDYYHDLLT